MELTKITNMALYQKEHWLEYHGELTEFIAKNNSIEVDGNAFTLNTTAFDQTLNRLGISGTHGDFKKDPEFFQKAIDRSVANLQVRSRAKDTLVIYDEKTYQAKAVRTTAYKRVFNHDVLVKGLSKYGDKFNEKFSYINDDRMFLSMSGIKEIAPKLTNKAVGDIMSIGMQLWNSETGMSVLGVGQLIVRLACTNGMTTSQILKPQKMVHIKSDLLERLNIAMEEIVSGNLEGLFTTIMNKPAIIQDYQQFPQILTDLKIKKSHHEGILKAYEQEPLGLSDRGINAWGIYSAITRYASNIFPQLPTFEPFEQQLLMGYGSRLLVR